MQKYRDSRIFFYCMDQKLFTYVCEFFYTFNMSRKGAFWLSEIWIIDSSHYNSNWRQRWSHITRKPSVCIKCIKINNNGFGIIVSWTICFPWISVQIGSFKIPCVLIGIFLKFLSKKLIRMLEWSNLLHFMKVIRVMKMTK